MTREAFRFPDWQEQYLAALLETVPSKVPRRVHAARAAIERRFILIENGAAHKAERKAIYDAIRVLDDLYKEFCYSLEALTPSLLGEEQTI